MTDDILLNRYKNQVRQLEEQVTSLKIENAALKQRERDLLTAVQLNEGIIKALEENHEQDMHEDKMDWSTDQ
jgi:hypothetical protein